MKINEVYLSDQYDHYKNEMDGIYDKKIYTKIINRCNSDIINHLLKGEQVYFPKKLSYLQVKRTTRNFNKPAVDWNASNKLKQQLLDEGKQLYDDETGKGHKWIVYYTDNDYCFVYWNRFYCNIPNKTVYKFVPTRSNKGLSTKLKQYLNSDERNKFTFDKIE
mgnify:CR=1 FL=1